MSTPKGSLSIYPVHPTSVTISRAGLGQGELPVGFRIEAWGPCSKSLGGICRTERPRCLSLVHCGLPSHTGPGLQGKELLVSEHLSSQHTRADYDFMCSL